MSVALHLNDPVDRAMVHTHLVVEVGTRLSAVIERMAAERAGGVLICDSGVVKGIFTERDLLRLLVAEAPLEDAVEKFMTPRPECLRPKNTLGTAIQCMADGGFRRLPVLDDRGRPLGVLKASGIVHELVSHFPKSVYNLPPQPQPAPNAREGA